MLGQELKQLRGERGLGMKHLAQLSGISRQHLYAIEGGENEHPFPETLLKLARGLSAWRSGEPDADDCAYVFHRLQVAAGYPVEAPHAAGPDGEAITTPVPEPLAGSILEIIESWPRWSKAERETATRLLDVASDIGRPDPATVTHDDSPNSKNDSPEAFSIIVRLNQYDQAEPAKVPSRIASAPTRELVGASR